MVEFTLFPSGLRTPHVGVEFDSSRATVGAFLQPHKILLIGQRLSTGTVAELVPTRVTSAGQGAVLFGPGSMLDNMIKACLDRNSFTELTVCAIDDAGGASQATGSFTITVTTALAGTLVAYVGGRRFAVGVVAGMAQNDIATALAAAIQASSDCPASASATTNAVTCTAENGGTAGQDIDLRVNFYTDEVLPGGVSVAVVAMNGGATDPDITEVWPVLGEEHYNSIAVGWQNAATTGAVDTELEDRWGPIRQIEGHAFFGARDTHSNLITLGDALNSEHITVMGADQPASSTWEIAASCAGAASFFLAADPARPLQTLELTGLLPPAAVDRFTLQERNLLLHDGIATLRVDAGGKFLIDRMITTYQETALGAPDTAFLDTMTKYTLAYLRFDWRTFLLTRYPRHKLGDDGVREFGAGQPIMTPGIGRGEAINRYRIWMELGLVEDLETFRANLVVQRNPTDPNRLDFLLPVNLINQLRIAATSIQFTL